MAQNTKGIGNKNTEQNILNRSFDEDFEVLAFELLAYDSVTDSLRRVTSDALNHFGTNDIDSNANGNTYEGLEDSDGNWQVVQISKSGTVNSNRFATIKNNPSVTNYSDAWAARTTTLTYDTYSIAF